MLKKIALALTACFLYSRLISAAECSYTEFEADFPEILHISESVDTLTGNRKPSFEKVYAAEKQTAYLFNRTDYRLRDGTLPDYERGRVNREDALRYAGLFKQQAAETDPEHKKNSLYSGYYPPDASSDEALRTYLLNILSFFKSRLEDMPAAQAVFTRRKGYRPECSDLLFSERGSELTDSYISTLLKTEYLIYITKHYFSRFYVTDSYTAGRIDALSQIILRYTDTAGENPPAYGWYSSVSIDGRPLFFETYAQQIPPEFLFSALTNEKPYRSPDSTSSKYAPRPDRIYIIKNIQTDVKYISAPSGDNGPVRYVYAQNTDTGSAGNQPVSGYVFRAGIGTYEGLVFSGDYIGQDGNRDTFRSDNFKAVKLDTVINRPGNFRVMINAEYAVSVKKKSDHPSVSIFSIAPGIIYSLYPDIFPYISAGLSFINEARSDFSRLGILYRIAEGKPYYAEAALTGTGGAEVKTSENLTALFKRQTPFFLALSFEF